MGREEHDAPDECVQPAMGGELPTAYARRARAAARRAQRWRPQDLVELVERRGPGRVLERAADSPRRKFGA
jgi:hypothetical protein